MLNDILNNPERLRVLFMQVAAFGLIVALWFGVLTYWFMRRSARDRELQGRLHTGRQPQQSERVLRLWQDGQVASETVVSELGGQSLGERLDRLRQDAGWTTPMPQVLALLGAGLATAFAVCWLLLGNLLLGVALVSVVLLAFRGYLAHCVTKRGDLFDKQLVDALDLGARSLRAGHPLSGAFRLISDEVEAPVGIVFLDIVEQESLGVSVQEALRLAADRARSADMRIFAASVVIQLRSGGNLADMMERVSWVIRERMRLSRRARVLTAEAQMSKWVLLALPIGLFVVLNVMNREYMQPFYTEPVGRLMLLGCCVMMLIGGWLMGRMAVLKY